MSAFARRPAVEELATVLDAARARSVLGPDDAAVVFHDLDLLQARLDELDEVFPGGTLHAVAIKANPLVEVLRLVVNAGHGLEAASIEEVHLAVAAGCPPDRIVFDSPAKTTAEITEALELGIRLNADNVDELRRIERATRPRHRSIVGLRINPMVGAGRIPTTGVAGARSKFGVPVHDALEPLVTFADRLPALRCLHMHIGSQGVGLQAHHDAAGVIADLRRRVHDRLGREQFDVVDLGGGLSTNYVDDEAMLPSRVVDGLASEAPELLDDVQLVTEYGRAIHANCGWAVSDVEYVKEVAGRPHAVIHVGADLLLRPVYQPGFWRHRITHVGAPDPGGDARAWTISGPLCFAGDIIARDVELGDVQPGDSLLVHDVGAYTVSMWSRHCSRGIPRVVGHRRRGRDVEFVLLRDRERPADIVRHWSAVPDRGVARD